LPRTGLLSYWDTEHSPYIVMQPNVMKPPYVYQKPYLAADESTFFSPMEITLQSTKEAANALTEVGIAGMGSLVTG